MSTFKLNKYLCFDKETGRFCMTSEGSKMIYGEKGIICSYSGANEWADFFTKEMINLYTGCSPYNHCLDCTDHHEAIPLFFKNDPEPVCRWVEKSTQAEWGRRMYKMIENIIDDLPNCNEE